ncbi:DUF4255 domain-containing protein [Cellulomonas composti]|uniref:Pvc16 N-terminal domain-containing protein n=1 Tax=Cellulomonas composti TaxID=266130 RepID=A0A511JB91_9CELL|nr:DUF4255 domain-containing protein [Cellulomonas composti]GEL95059.1 hypothetical protein CCO02nite_17170 [Cellulomonas composti]
MLIPAIDDGLERLLRATLPLPEDQGDISFDPPSSTWSAQVNRLTVNLYLYQVARSPQPPRPAEVRGNGERRRPLPMVQLHYLVSAWAGSPRDEHSLLGDVMTRLVAQQVLPTEYLQRPPSSTVQLAIATDELNRPRELWSGLGGTLKASFTLTATVAADAYDFEPLAPPVAAIEPVTTQLRDPLESVRG